MKEIWKDIKGLEGKCQVSNLGRVKTLKKQWRTGKFNALITRKGCIRKLIKFPRSYRINLGKMHSVHRLVAHAFIPNPHNYPNICHKDDNPFNNRVDNLFWGTQKMNMEDMVKKGRSIKGEKHLKAKLNEKQVKVIKWCKRIDPSIKNSMLADFFGVSREAINGIIFNRNWKHIII